MANRCVCSGPCGCFMQSDLDAAGLAASTRVAGAGSTFKPFEVELYHSDFYVVNYFDIRTTTAIQGVNRIVLSNQVEQKRGFRPFSNGDTRVRLPTDAGQADMIFGMSVEAPAQAVAIDASASITMKTPSIGNVGALSFFRTSTTETTFAHVLLFVGSEAIVDMFALGDPLAEFSTSLTSVNVFTFVHLWGLEVF